MFPALAIPALADLSAALTSDNSFWAVIGLVLVTLVLLMLRWRRSQGVRDSSTDGWRLGRWRS